MGDANPAPDLAARQAPRFCATPPRGSVLCFAPHPDDEVIGPGGTLAAHVSQGDEVKVVVATDGIAGDPDGAFPRADYVALRRGESRAGLRELGITAVAFWGYPDSCVITPTDIDAVTTRAIDELRATRPDVVYLPWEGEHNTDHRALALGVRTALQREQFRGHALAYEVWSPLEPDLLIDIEPVIDRKRRAIACYATQLHYVDYAHVILGLNAYRSLHCGRGRGHAEAFRILVEP